MKIYRRERELDILQEIAGKNKNIAEMLQEGSEKDAGKLRECEKVARKLQESFGKVSRKLQECQVSPEYPANSWLYFCVGRHI